MLHNIITRFANADTAPSAEVIASELQLPISVIQTSTSELVNCALIVELNASDDEEITYQPARDINTISIAAVTKALETVGQNFIPGTKGEVLFNKIDQLDDSYLLKDF